jgi:hypothetical protein
MYVLGIDPGLDGGFCVLSEDGIIEVFKTPKCTRPKRKGNYIDVEKIYEFISKHNYITDIYIERQFILRSQGMSSGSKTMYQVGILYGLSWSFCKNTNEINAKDWQDIIFPKVDLNSMVDYNYSNDTKLKSIAYVEQNYGKDYLFHSSRQRKPSDGLADAICIASAGLELSTTKTTKQK